MKKIAIFASGRGSNALNIINYFEADPTVKVALIISNNPTALVLDIGKQFDIDTLVIQRKSFYETEEIIAVLRTYAIDFVVLAGFLWLIPAYLVRAFEGKIVNIHPALLPKFGGKGMYGMKVHEAVKSANETSTGITIHYVNENYDEGAVIFQASCPVTDTDTPDTIAQKVHQLEYQFFPKIIQKVLKQIT